MWSIDDWIAQKMVGTGLFKYCSPNGLTMIGIFANMGISYFYFTQDLMNMQYCLVTRYFMDIWDGEVARKYKKVSSIGGLLDTISDCMLLSLYGYFLGERISGSSEIGVVTYGGIMLGHIMYMISNKALCHHDNIKRGAKGRIAKIVQFMNNNSIFPYIAFGILNVSLCDQSEWFFFRK